MTEGNKRNLKDDILQVAETLFMEYGYDATTFQKIADELSITKGAITYHFKNKHLIMAHLFDRYFQSLRDFINSFPSEYTNRYCYYCIMYIYAYRQIMKTTRNRELFYHEEQMSQWQTGKVSTIYRIYRRIHDDFHKSYTHEDLTIKTYMDLGARRRLYTEYTNDPQLLTIDKFCYYHVYLIGTLCKLDEHSIQENIHIAFDFADLHTPPPTRFLAQQ